MPAGRLRAEGGGTGEGDPMYEHPHYQYTRFEQQELARRAELRRFIAEHPDQIVPRQEGAVRRMLRRIGVWAHRHTGAASPRDAAASTRSQASCDPVAAR